MFRILIGFCIIAASLADTVFHSDVSIPDGRIVNGQIVNIQTRPYQISLQYRENHFCGGTIVASDKIITAAHCFNKYKLHTDWTIVAGSSKLNPLASESQVKRVRGGIIHTAYFPPSFDNDVAVLFLDGHLEFNKFVKPISLARKRPNEGASVIISGWGLTSENGYGSNDLRAAMVNVINNVNCKKAYPTLTGNMLCAGGYEKDACQGDSGGPLVYNGQLLGIVSWGIGCASGYPGVYTSVPNVLQWLGSAIINN